MWRGGRASVRMCCLWFLWTITFAWGQTAAPTSVLLTLVDETGIAVAGAQVTLLVPGRGPIQLVSDYAGHIRFQVPGAQVYTLTVRKSGFYQKVAEKIDPELHEVRIQIDHEQMLVQQVNVNASTQEIDPQQISDKFTMDVPAIVNLPYPTSRDIRNLLPYFPGVVQDSSGQVHVAGSETWATLDLLDGFDIRSPLSGNLAMRFSADAVRSIDQETTRYPVEYGRATGGVVAFYTGMGDNKFRFNATNFIPSFRQSNGIRFDKFVPRVTVSGPLIHNRAWFFDGAEVEYDDIYIQELPQTANTNHLIRGSNLFRIQANADSHSTISAGLLYNHYHSPYDGLSSLVPQQSTMDRNTIAWFPYGREQHTFASGALLDVGIGMVRFRDGYEPHGNDPYEITPERSQGSYFENLTSRSQRVEENTALYIPPQQWMGRHDLKAGVDLDHIGFDEKMARAPIRYLREDGTLLRESTFPAIAPFTRHNVEVGAYVQDRWTPRGGLLIEPGLRFDWDEILRAPLPAPRLAATYSPRHSQGRTKISAGIGLYYEHTQLEYLARALAGTRFDTYYAADGLTATGPTATSNFTYDQSSLRPARAVNWSVGVERRLLAAVYVKASYIHKNVSRQFTYANQSGPAALFGNFALTNERQDHDRVFAVEGRRSFAGGYTLFGAYTHSTAHTNAAINFYPTLSMLGAQQSGPLPWDTPDRVLSWGWLPFDVPWFRKDWDFVYTFDWHTGFPFTAVHADRQVAGAVGAYRFPDYLSFSPGLEWRFHLRGSYFGLRGVLENATGRTNPAIVNNVIDSPQFGVFTEPLGRAFTARIRLIESKK